MCACSGEKFHPRGVSMKFFTRSYTRINVRRCSFRGYVFNLYFRGAERAINVFLYFLRAIYIDEQTRAIVTSTARS